MLGLRIMETGLIILGLAAVLGYGIFMTVRRFRKGSACCGEHEKALRRDPKLSRRSKGYSHVLWFKVTGMTCSNCARRLEQAWNAIDGVRARVDLNSARAELRFTKEPDQTVTRRIISSAAALGYGARLEEGPGKDTP